MRLAFFITLILTLAAAGCDRASKAAESSAPPPTLLIAPEDVVTVRPLAVSSGPLITGTIQPDRKADLRAEISAVVLAVLKENGQPVKKGDLLVRLDDMAIRDSLVSSQEAQRTATQAFEQAERQFQRLSTLRASGMVSAQQMEDAEIRRNTTQSDLSAAGARVAQARQQLQRTESRAPFDGLVSDRKVSAGDTVQIGRELVKVIDPAHLRFEGLVSSDALSSVKPGQAVNFRVNGWGAQEFNGRIRLVAPAANPTTRQVEVLVDIEGSVPARMAGLYAEGRIEAASSVALMIPSSSVVRDGERAFAWKVQGAALRKVALSLGERDVRRGDFAVQSGVADGDQLLRHPVATLKDGQTVSSTAPAGGLGASNSASAASAPIVR